LIKFQQATNPVIGNLQPEDKYGILLMKWAPNSPSTINL